MIVTVCKRYLKIENPELFGACVLYVLFIIAGFCGMLLDVHVSREQNMTKKDSTLHSCSLNPTPISSLLLTGAMPMFATWGTGLQFIIVDQQNLIKFHFFTRCQ